MTSSAEPLPPPSLPPSLFPRGNLQYQHVHTSVRPTGERKRANSVLIAEHAVNPYPTPRCIIFQFQVLYAQNRSAVVQGLWLRLTLVFSL